MPEPNEPDDEVRKKVIYEHVSTSGTTKQNVIVIVVLLVIALVLVGWILMHLHR
jgi:high-affinity Fe2+/Pb2+ permease